MNEFRTIPDSPEYEIDKYGTVRNTQNGKEIRIYNTADYPSVKLKANGIAKYRFVHRLVAICFVDNPHGKPLVNHIDGNKRNFAANNLEWCTAKENVNHYFENLHPSNNDYTLEISSYY